MSDLIRRETALEALGTFSDKKHANCHFWYGIQSAVEIIESAPAVDAVEVVHGEWIREDETQALLSVMWHCSECKVTLEMNGIYTPIGVGYKFCPNCGAKMDKRGESEGK